MVIAVRTPPYNSWKDSGERITSLLNIGLQSVGLMRPQCQNDEIEKALERCKSMKDVRNLESAMLDVKEEVIESLEPVKELLNTIFERLSLKEKKFQTLLYGTKFWRLTLRSK